MADPSRQVPAAADPFDPESFDFVAYVARRHGLERRDAEPVVARWLRVYEPSAEARRAFEREGPRSGVRCVVPSRGEQRTGTSG
jgi:hypothetical protein